MIICPTCQKRTAVVDSRPRDGTIWRYRQCKSCGYSVSTIEARVGEKKELINLQRALGALTVATNELVQKVRSIVPARVTADPKANGNILRSSKE